MSDRYAADLLAECLMEAFVSEDRETNVAEALQGISSALHRLGNADAATPMGGLEAHGLAVHEASEKIEMGLCSVASAIQELADAVREVANGSGS
ncbi:MAG: hypothetical protein M3P49_02160 [Actinomycetota bacterium]|nr:hypothetical protein [Actinomycetota bacterium]